MALRVIWQFIVPQYMNITTKFSTLKLLFFSFFEILEILKFFEILIFFLKISEFSLIDDEVRVFQINRKLLSNPVAELKVRENDSHCRSIVLKTIDQRVVSLLRHAMGCLPANNRVVTR
jgi:hypothetical protein